MSFGVGVGIKPPWRESTLINPWPATGRETCIHVYSHQNEGARIISAAFSGTYIHPNAFTKMYEYKSCLWRLSQTHIPYDESYIYSRTAHCLICLFSGPQYQPNPSVCGGEGVFSDQNLASSIPPETCQPTHIIICTGWTRFSTSKISQLVV